MKTLEEEIKEFTNRLENFQDVSEKQSLILAEAELKFNNVLLFLMFI